MLVKIEVRSLERIGLRQGSANYIRQCVCAVTDL